MPSRLGLVGTAVMALSCSTSGLWAQDTRSQDFYIWPDAGPYLNRQLGSVMAADGDHLAFSLQYGGDAFDGGSIVFMHRSGGWGNTWSELERVSGPASGAYRLGSALANDDDRVLATQTEFGEIPSVFLYTYADGTWLDDVINLGHPGGATSTFGQSLAIDGDLLAVGDPDSNRVYIFRDTGGATVLVDTVVPVAGLPQSFGSAIAMNDDLLAVGDPDDGSGRVDLYQVNAGAGATHITQIDTAGTSVGAGDEFGAVLALDGDVLAIGATRSGSVDPGRLLIFERNSVNYWWNRFDEGPLGGLGGFPASIDVEGGMVIAGAPGAFFGGEEGAAMVCRRGAFASWTMTEALTLSSDATDAYAGSSVALAYGEALVGAPGRSTFDGFPQNTGAIASYSMDCDSDGVPDVEEVALGTEVDYDGDGIPDYCELDEFVIVPLDFATIQAAIAGAAGRIILLEPGTYAEQVVVDGIDTDIRAFVPNDPPVWSAGFEGGVALHVDHAAVRLTTIAFDSNQYAIDGSTATIRTHDCSFTGNGCGVLLVDSDLTASACTFENNVSIGAGGAAIFGTAAELTLSGCDFIGNGGNSAPSSAQHKGGAIHLSFAAGNSIHATNCNFEHNQARVEHVQVGSEPSGEVVGGAIYAASLSENSSFWNCTFRDNLVYSGLEQTGGGDGANNRAEAGAVYLDTDLAAIFLSFTDCTFERNEVRSLDAIGGGGLTGAGSIVIDGALGNVQIERLTVRDPIATRTYIDGSMEEIGYASPTIDISSEILGVSDSQFENMTGMLFQIPGNAMTTTMSNCSFYRCGLVQFGSPGTCTSTSFTETHLQIQGDVASCSFERVDSHFRAALILNGWNVARSVTDCQFHQIAAPLVIDGGTEDFPVIVSGTTICGNAAQSFESDLTWFNGGGNTIEGGPNGTSPCPSGRTINVPADHGSIDEALRAANNEDMILLAAGTYGEAVDARGFGNLTIAGAGMGSTTIDPPDGEAGIRIADGTIEISDLTISGASPGVDADRGTVLLSRVILENNTGTCGAAMRLGEGDYSEGDGAEAYIADSIVRNNVSSGDGGGICVGVDAALIVETCDVDENIAGASGGGIFAFDGARDIAITASSFNFNSAVYDGGAVCAGVTDYMGLMSTTFASNVAGRFGGGAQIATGELESCIFTANTAGEVGGGYRTTGTSVLTNCDFQVNIAGNGGGLAATAIETYVDGFTACGNVGGDWHGNVLEIEGVPLYCSSDCNNNGIPDADEIEAGTASDCNGNLIPDVCEDLSDVDGNGVPDECDPLITQQTLIAMAGVVTGLPADAVDVLVRPLFRNGERTHDVLVLAATGVGSITSIIPDADASYIEGATLVGGDFERCCYRLGADPACVNNGPSGASNLAFARGDIVISHPVGDTGLFDEDLEMYYGCNAPAGAGLPAPITDYDLAPDTDVAISIRYVEEEERGGLASSAMPLSVDRAGQTLTAIPVAGGGPRSTSGRRGSGQGGTGPYPGEDAVNDYGLSINGIATGNFNGDASDDLVLLHPEEGTFSVRNFTGLADFPDPDSGENVPSGATWSEPTITETNDLGVAVVTGQFVDLAGEEDDGLDDVAVVVDTVTGLQLVVWASSAPNTLVQVGSPYPLLAENFALGKSRVRSDGTEVLLIAQRDVKGMTYLDYFAYDAVTGVFQFDWIFLEFGSIEAISTAPITFGVSAREVVAVLVNTGESTSVHLVELGQRPPHPIPDNDECSNPIALVDGDNPFTTLGATDGGPELPSECESEGSAQLHKDTWYTWLASCSGEVTVSTCGTADFDTWLVAYVGDCNGFVIACNDEDIECAENTSKMTFEAVEGTTYHVRVGSWVETAQGSGILTVTCPSGSVADLNGDGTVDGADLASLLGGWGQPGPTDLNGDGTTDGADLATLLGEWTI